MPKILGWVSFKDLGEEAPYDEEHRELLIQYLIDSDYVICGDTHQYFLHPQPS